MFIVYKVFYKNESNCVYVGRSKQLLHKRLYQHFTIKIGSKNTVKLDIDKVDYVQYAECNSESDMMIYEIYYISKILPRLNIESKSKTKDLTLELPQLQFLTFYNYLIEEWKYKFRLKNQDKNNKIQEKERIANIFKLDMDKNRIRLNNNEFSEWMNNMKNSIGYRYYNELYINKN